MRYKCLKCGDSIDIGVVIIEERLERYIRDIEYGQGEYFHLIFENENKWNKKTELKKFCSYNCLFWYILPLLSPDIKDRFKGSMSIGGMQGGELSEVRE